MRHLGCAGGVAGAAGGGGGGAGPPGPVRGRLVDPQGRPVAGAQVVVRSGAPEPSTWPTARSGGDGRFAVATPPGWEEPRAARSRATLTATAPGFGVGWAAADPQASDAEVCLVAEGPALEGRVVDAAGKPVAGARVVVRAVLIPRRSGPDESPAAALDRFLAAPEGRVFPGRLDSVEATLLAPTGGNGRFVIRGWGRPGSPGSRCPAPGSPPPWSTP